MRRWDMGYGTEDGGIHRMVWRQEEGKKRRRSRAVLEERTQSGQGERVRGATQGRPRPNAVSAGQQINNRV